MIYKPNIAGFAPKTNKEFCQIFGTAFQKWVLCFTVIDIPTAIKPEDWPRHFWLQCECNKEYWNG